jgi:hypothetical protein
MTLVEFTALKRGARSKIMTGMFEQYATGQPHMTPGKIKAAMATGHVFVDECKQKSLMADHTDFAVMAANTVSIAHQLLANDGNFKPDGNVKWTKSKPRKPKTDPMTGFMICLTCEVHCPSMACMHSQTECLCCRKTKVSRKQYTDVLMIVSKLVNHAKDRHKKKANGNMAIFDPTVKKVLQAIVTQSGYCSISHVLPIVLMKQSPFFVSIEQIDAKTQTGYSVKNWSIGTDLMNLWCNVTDDDLLVLATGDTSSIDETMKLLPLPRPKPSTPKPTNYNHETHGCCRTCYKILINPLMNACGNCKYCRFQYNRQPETWLKKMVNNTIQSDKRAKRPPPIGVTTDLLQSLMDNNDKNTDYNLLPDVGFKYNKIVRGDKHNAFVASCDRLKNGPSHNFDNIRMIPAMFNCVDRNENRTSLGLVVPPGKAQPYRYYWSKTDVDLFRSLLRNHVTVTGNKRKRSQ